MILYCVKFTFTGEKERFGTSDFILFGGRTAFKFLDKARWFRPTES